MNGEKGKVQETGHESRAEPSRTDFQAASAPNKTS